jgi:CRP-like cAMP-binding protein
MDFISRIPIFSSFDLEVIEFLTAKVARKRYHTGEWIAHRGDVWPYLIAIYAGEVTAIKESLEGRSLILETMRPGEVFWGLAFFTEGAQMPAGLKASQETELFLWSRERMMPLLMEHGEVSWALARLVAQRVQRASEIVDELAFQPVMGRLAGLLLDHYDDAVGDFVARDLTLDEMAARIGSTREMVCRMLYRFSESGAILINRTEFKISDSEMLENYARKEKG